ncbi:MAG: amidohydrolase [Thermoplasmata archaeon]
MRIGFYNGYIYDPKNDNFISNLIVEGNRILDVDNYLKLNECVLKVDLNKKMLIPAFVDTHLHLDEIGIFLNSLNLKDVNSINELRLKIKNFNKKGPIFGMGWDDEKMGRWPTIDDISEFNDEYILLARNDLHSGLVNKKLETDADLNTEDGIVKEKEFERARDFMIKNIPMEIKEKYLKDSINYLNFFGITTVGYMSCYGDWCKILRKLDINNDLTLRIFSYLNYEEIVKRDELYFGKYYKEHGLKVYSDGSLGSKTAYLSFNYENDINNRGVKLIEDEKKFKNICEKFDCDLAVHAIGDAALDIVLEMAKFHKKIRIEHASLVRDDQLKKLKNMRISIQPGFILTDFWIDKRIGKERLGMAYRIKDLIKDNLVSFSSDAPVEIPNPFRNIYASVYRGKFEKLPISETDQNISLKEAVKLHTYNGAKFFDLESGAIEKGFLADFVVINKNIFDEEDILNLHVENVYFDGKLISTR